MTAWGHNDWIAWQDQQKTNTNFTSSETTFLNSRFKDSKQEKQNKKKQQTIKKYANSYVAP